MTSLGDARFCVSTGSRHCDSTSLFTILLRCMLKVETQNLASHKQHTRLQHADYNRNKLRWLPRETQDFASLQAYAIVMKQYLQPLYYAIYRTIWWHISPSETYIYANMSHTHTSARNTILNEYSHKPVSKKYWQNNFAKQERKGSKPSSV